MRQTRTYVVGCRVPSRRFNGGRTGGPVCVVNSCKAFVDALSKARAIVLEPIVNVDIVAPDERTEIE